MGRVRAITALAGSAALAGVATIGTGGAASAAVVSSSTESNGCDSYTWGTYVNDQSPANSAAQTNVQPFGCNVPSDILVRVKYKDQGAVKYAGDSQHISSVGQADNIANVYRPAGTYIAEACFGYSRPGTGWNVRNTKAGTSGTQPGCSFDIFAVPLS